MASHGKIKATFPTSAVLLLCGCWQTLVEPEDNSEFNIRNYAQFNLMTCVSLLFLLLPP